MLFEFLKIIFLNIFLALATLWPQNNVSIGLIGKPETFLPSQATLDSEKIVSDMVFRKLFKYSEGELVPDLIADWDVSEDKSEYTLKLKEDIYWQDGKEITSNDIIYSFSQQISLINEVELEKTSDKEVKVKLKSPLGILPTLLTFGIEPAHLEGQSKIIPIGSTSYRVARVIRERSRIQSVILQSFGQNKQYNRINFKFYSNDAELKSAYSLREISVFSSPQEFAEDGILKNNITYLGRYFVIIFNTSNPRLSDVENREVLAKSLNTSEFLQKTYFVNALPAQGAISQSPYTRDELEEGVYDENIELTAAQKNILTSLVVLVPNNSDGRQIESLLRENWEEKLGIELEIRFLDLNELINEAKDGGFDVLYIGQEVTPDPDRYVFWHSSQIGKFNFSEFEDLRSDKALEEGRLASTFEERLPHYNIFQDVISTKYPSVFVYHPGTYLYTSERTPIPLPKKIYNPSDILDNL